MSARELGAYHIAATIGCSVKDLRRNISYKEYMGWVEYFEHINSSEESSKPNPLDDDSGSALLQEFGF